MRATARASVLGGLKVEREDSWESRETRERYRYRERGLRQRQRYRVRERGGLDVVDDSDAVLSFVYSFVDWSVESTDA